MKRKLLWAVGAIALVGLGAAGWMKLQKKDDSAPQGGVFTVKKGDYKITVTEEGTFQARKSINLMVTPQAFYQQMTIKKIVDEGANVTKDEVLIELDPTEIERMIAQTDVELQAERNNVVQAEEELRVRKLQNDLDIERANARVVSSKMEIEKWQKLEMPRRITEAQIRIDDAKQ